MSKFIFIDFRICNLKYLFSPVRIEKYERSSWLQNRILLVFYFSQKAKDNVHDFLWNNSYFCVIRVKIWHVDCPNLTVEIFDGKSCRRPLTYMTRNQWIISMVNTHGAMMIFDSRVGECADRLWKKNYKYARARVCDTL